ncbi:MAG: hypothetical protein C0448_13595 [Sphingobacteriaceae bacterium]|nr:hypothetical protein [Sphingobacteriaceae bacterium]
MEILYAIRHKGKIALLLLIIIFLGIFSSQTYNDNISKIGDSFSEVYSDRIIAQDYIYKMVKILHKVEFVLSQPFTDDLEKKILFTADDRLEISLLLENYEHTKLTAKEKVIFNEFKNNILVMIAFEKKYLNEHNYDVRENIFKSQTYYLNQSLNQLDKLSEIQISRVKDLNEKSQKSVSFSTLLNQFDWALLIIIGIAIQMLIFSSKSSKPKQPQNQFLN